MAARGRTWVWVVAGIAVVLVLGLVALAGVGFFLFSRHFETTTATAADASARIGAVHARLGGHPPLLAVDASGHVVRPHREPPLERPTGPEPSELHLLVYDPSSDKLVRFRLPFWLLRMGGTRGHIGVDGRRVTLEELKLDVEELRRLGPILVLDHRTPDGERIVAWTQ